MGNHHFVDQQNLHFHYQLLQGGSAPPRGSAAQFFGRPFWTLNPKVPVAMRVVADHQIILIMSKPMLMWKHLTIGCPSHTWHHPKPAPVGSPDVLWPVSETSQEKSFTASAQSNSSCCQNRKFKSASPRNEKKYIESTSVGQTSISNITPCHPLMLQPNPLSKTLDCAHLPFFCSPKGEDAEDRQVQRSSQWMNLQLHYWMIQNIHVCFFASYMWAHVPRPTLSSIGHTCTAVRRFEAGWTAARG